MNLVKAEILWTRKCSLTCDYCSMATGEMNSFPIDRWIKGIDNLKSLGCKFIAFYGAEPLSDFDNLPIVVGYAESIGIDTTVITSGAVPNFKEKIKILYGVGLRSLTMSYDIVSFDSASQTKTLLSEEGLEYFKSLGRIRDVAVVVTLNRINYPFLIETIKRMSSNGIWTFFDFVHGDRGQSGSKCGPLSEDIAFKDHDFEGLGEVLREVMILKAQGFRCHTSKKFVDMITRNNFELIKKYNWDCSQSEAFPSWVTVNCDGKVYACDDFQKESIFYIDDLHQRWEPFSTFMKDNVFDYCPGCCWNTHIDAHLIKEGKLDIGSYVHGKV